jgi:GNAT superfamily N-acetyltransferase
MHNVVIEPYSEAYKKEVASFIIGIQNGEFGIPISLEMQPDLSEIPRIYQVNDGNFWIARKDEEVVGTIALLDIGNHQGALRKMFVAKQYRGKEFGIGQALLDTLVEWAGDRGMVELLLGTTEKFLGAQRFYEKNGFKEIRKQDLPAEFPLMAVDVKFYRLNVSP